MKITKADQSEINHAMADLRCSENVKNFVRAALIEKIVAAHSANNKPFQERTGEWMIACFGELIAADVMERNHRFLEEALELVQACGCTPGEAHQLVDYVYSRPIGDKEQESGGVSITHAALCNAQGIDLDAAADKELARCWLNQDKIRAKQSKKPKHSPLPEAV